MSQQRFVSYLRVSTDRQGRSGLGLEAQRQAVAKYLRTGESKLVGEFIEIESGRKADRPEFAKAILLCRAHRAALVVAKVDRLARSQSFLSRVLDSGVDVRFCDLPQIEGPTGRFLLQQMMSVAELEAGLISQRTKAALSAAKARGAKLGGFRGRAGTAKDTEKARAARKRISAEKAGAVGPIIERLDPKRSLTLRGLAAALNDEKIPPPSGRGSWTATTVSRALALTRQPPLRDVV